MKPVYLVIGVSGCGKSWVCRQLKDKFTYVPHDICWTHPNAKPEGGEDPKWGPPGSESIHLGVLTLMAKNKQPQKPILSECPFAEGDLREGLEKNGIPVVSVFIVEDPRTVAQRYEMREHKPIPKSALSRATTIVHRAVDWKSFYGTSAQVLKHLENIEL